jgi:hypothetical protein
MEKGQSRMGISSKLRWPFSQIQKKGGLSLTSMVGATSATQVSAMHRLTALPRCNRTWAAKPLRAPLVPFLKGHKSWIAALA